MGLLGNEGRYEMRRTVLVLPGGLGAARAPHGSFHWKAGSNKGFGSHAKLLEERAGQEGSRAFGASH